MSKRKTKHILAYRAKNAEDETLLGVLNKETMKYWLLRECERDNIHYMVESVGHNGCGVPWSQSPSAFLNFFSEKTRIIL